MSTPTYQVGQAVISSVDTDYELELWVITSYDDFLEELNVESLIEANYSYLLPHEIQRPATEAEILDEAKKNGWDINSAYKNRYEGLFFMLLKENEWNWSVLNDPFKDELKEYCKEGLIADRLIKALNLCKP